MLLRSFIAIAAGFALMLLCVAIATLLAKWLAPGLNALPPSRAARIFNLAGSAAFGAMGGCLTALLAPVSPLVHTLILSIIVLVVSTLAANELRGVARGVYPLALAVLPSMATLAGGIGIVLYR